MYWNLEAFAPFSLARWLTLTWDVLKLFTSSILLFPATSININMRCIEIHVYINKIYVPVAININMRCIEILPCLYSCTSKSRLTLTWDVLK